MTLTPLARRALPRAVHRSRALRNGPTRATRAHSPLLRTVSGSSHPADPNDDKRDESGQFQGKKPRDAAAVTAPSSWLEDVRETLARARARAAVFTKYEAHEVFQPSSSRLVRLSNWLVFYQLNRPRETQVDLVEFLQGAKYAMEATMMAMYSREFAAFASSGTKSVTTGAEASNVVRRLRLSLEPVSLEAFTEFVSYSSTAGIRSELQKLELHSAHVVGVSFKRVPTRPTTNSNGAVVTGIPVYERLAIQVLFDVTEHFRMTLPSEDGREESAINDEEVVVRHNKSIWQFESNVTSVEDIDWTIEPLELATT